MNPKTEILAIRVPTEIKQWFVDESERRGMNMSDFVRILLEAGTGVSEEMLRAAIDANEKALKMIEAEYEKLQQARETYLSLRGMNEAYGLGAHQQENILEGLGPEIRHKVET